MKIIARGKLEYIQVFTQRDPKYPNAIRITECIIEAGVRMEKMQDISIQCSTAILKENIVKLLELGGKNVNLECEYVFFDNNYKLIKVL